MRTPAGRECRYYYEDFYRGRNLQECRIKRGEASLPWHLGDCGSCKVPEILEANASEYLELILTLPRTWFGLGRRTSIEAWCARHALPIEDPRLGCLECAKEMGIPDL